MTDQAESNNKPQGMIPAFSFALIAIIVIIVLAGLLIPVKFRLAAYLLTLILLVIFTLILGKGITGHWLAVLIDERNRISLARLQIFLWSVVVLSGFVAASLSNIAHGGSPASLVINIPSELWMLMGISTTSLVASPLIKNTKIEDTEVPEDVQVNAKAKLESLGSPRGSVEIKGKVVVNTHPQYASFTDIFKGEEVGNGTKLDLAKIQMFYFTIIVVFAYAVGIAQLFLESTSVLQTLPPLDNSLLALIGISHTGYLVHKAIPRSPIT